MNDKVNGHVEESSDDLISACVVFDITVKDGNGKIIQQKDKDGKLVDSLKYHRPFITLPGETAYNMINNPRSSIIISDRAEETKVGSPRKLSPLVRVDYYRVTVIPVAKDDVDAINKVFGYLRNIDRDDITILSDALQAEGLNCVEAKNVVFDGMVHLHLDIHLDYKPSALSDGFVLDSMDIWFMDTKDRRISSIQKIYPIPRKRLFQRMKIGPDAGHKFSDGMVVRNLHCRYCARKLATGTIAELTKEDKLKDVCDGCRETENAMGVMYNNEDPEITRTYKITGSASMIDNLEVLFREITIMSNVGASREIKLYIDGDGAVDINIKREDGEELKKNCRKYGVLKRERYYGEGYETGYLTYLDLG